MVLATEIVDWRRFAASRAPARPPRAKAISDRALAARVERFPDDTKELGATTNVQGQAVRAAGRLFLHIEMSGESRARLLNEEPLAITVFQSLILAIGQK